MGLRIVYILNINITNVCNEGVIIGYTWYLHTQWKQSKQFNNWYTIENLFTLSISDGSK